MKTHFFDAGKAAIVGAMLALPLSVNAGIESEVERNAQEAKAEVQADARDAKDGFKDAWREGKLESAYLFNRHLNNFTIDVEVDGKTATLTGKVESEVDKELAEQVALSIEGITAIKNDLMIAPSEEARSDSANEGRELSDKVEDATLTAEVKLKLLANGETSGMAIDVDTRNRSVTLSGEVDSAAEKALAEQLAANVEGVKRVDNQLTVENS